MKRTLLISALATVMSTVPAFAKGNRADGFQSESDRANYLTLQSVTIRELHDSEPASGPDSEMAATFNSLNIHDADTIILNAPGIPGVSAPAPAPGPLVPTTPPAASTSGDSILGPIIGAITNPANIQGWVTLGVKLWDMVTSNRPVANVATNRVSVMPVTQADWARMDGWKGPYAKNFVIEATNMFGSKVISHAYTISYSYGGQINGQGQYIANATMIPSHVSVSWGYTLNSKVEVGDVINLGSATNPIPGINMQLDWSIDNMFKHSQGAETYMLKGTGSVDRINPDSIQVN